MSLNESSINAVRAYVKANPDKHFTARPVSLFGFGVFELEEANRARLLICELSREEASEIASGRF